MGVEVGSRMFFVNDDSGDIVCLMVFEVFDLNLGKVVVMCGIFDDIIGINVEMKQDGIEVVLVGSLVFCEMQNVVVECGFEFGIMVGM